MEKIENILNICIKDIKAGKATLSECLERYPSKRNDLEPLLKLALNIEKPPAINLDDHYKQAIRSRLLQQIQTTSQSKFKSITDRFSFGMPPQLAWARVAVLVVVIIIFVSMMAGGTVYASQDSLPGDMLYPVKTGTEDARLLIAGSNSAKVDLNMKFANTRIIEINEIATRDENKSDLALEGYRGNLDAARRQILKTSDTSVLLGLLDRAMEQVHKQMIFCDDIIDTNPAFSMPIKEANGIAVNEQLELLKMLAQHDILQAAQINLGIMQNRLQRAGVQADSNQYQTMQDVLLQYQQFNQLGEQILQSAQTANNNSSEIEQLSLQALDVYLEMLNSIYQHVPQEYRKNIEVSRQMTLQFETQARNRYQHQGDSAQGSNTQSSDNSGGSATGPDGQSNPAGQGNNGNTGSEIPVSQSTGDSTGNGGPEGSGSGPGPGSGDGIDPTATPEPPQGSEDSPGKGTGEGSGPGGTGEGQTPSDGKKSGAAGS